MITAKQKSRKKSLIWSSVIIILGLIFYAFVLRPQQQFYQAHHIDIKGMYLIKPLAVTDFAVTDTHNQQFSKQNLKGHWTFMFFGFTHCEMVCPITLSALNAMYRQLEKTLPKEELPQIVFITVDPERDSLTDLDTYVTNFNPQFIGAKTSNDKTLALVNQFHIESEKKASNKTSAGYTISHSSEILLINPKAEIQAYFSYPPQAELLVKDYNSIVSKAKTG
jgi:protein SCO1